MATFQIQDASDTAIVMTKKDPPAGVVIVYGLGDDLGEFSVFAEYLKKDLIPDFKKRIALKHIELKKDFFDYLLGFNEGYLIKEMHVFCHSIGGGLFPGYGGSASENSRNNAFNNAKKEGRNITYEEVRDAEIGAILSDDFITPGIQSLKTKLRSKFCKDATIKLWGCHAGAEGYYYKDDDGDGDGKPEVYWSVLNTRLQPKPSIALVFAEYFNLKTMGAKSGTHIEVFDNGEWITSKVYQTKYGKWANPALIKHRLQPDEGSYYEYTPFKE